MCLHDLLLLARTPDPWWVMGMQRDPDRPALVEFNSQQITAKRIMTPVRRRSPGAQRPQGIKEGFSV